MTKVCLCKTPMIVIGSSDHNKCWTCTKCGKTDYYYEKDKQMVWISIYLIIGTIFMAYLDYSLKDMEEWSDEEPIKFSNVDRVKIIGLWPISICVYIYSIIKTIKESD